MTSDTTPTPTTVPAIMTPMPTPTMPVNHKEKLDKFNGTDFKRWQQKIMFCLTIMNLEKFLRNSCASAP